MSQGPCPAAKTSRGGTPNRLTMPRLPVRRSTVVRSAMMALQLQGWRRCTLEIDCFTFFYPFHDVKTSTDEKPRSARLMEWLRSRPVEKKAPARPEWKRYTTDWKW